ncbi:MAG: DUF885 domain-containing protein [Myxococcaceae bacterium]|nr:MAG: DUF885 domain-containing protein [Myxococcaceae bacterium]
MRIRPWPLLLVLAALPALAAPIPDWVRESDAAAQPMLRVMAQFAPEGAQRLGVEGVDDKVLDLGPTFSERYRAALETAAREVQAKLPATREPKVREDIQILIDNANRQIDASKLEDALLLPFFTPARTTFGGIFALLDPRIPKERQAAALVRLRRYTGLEPGSTPITELAKARTVEKLGDKKLIGPFRPEVDQALADSKRLVAGIGELFKKAGLTGYEPALAKLGEQMAAYDAWVTAEILPRCRAEARLPPELYAVYLRNFGVNASPEAVLRAALISFSEIRNEMNALAPLIAKAHKLPPNSDYRAVLRALKKKQLRNADILPLYTQRLAALEEITRRERVVTLPQRKASIRLASEAESAMSPAPHMDAPRLIGNTGEYGEFVLPLATPGAAGQKDLRTDDFTFDAATWTLTVHEARPGHELQFTRMIENGVSIARAVFAFNSANVEGWALYAEAEMKPYLPIDGQVASLQHRMLRAARAFLDPMVNLGQITPEVARRVLMEDVVLSEGMAKQEVDRYTFRAPGQATSYFVGYQSMLETRQRAELALSGRLDRQRFHDFILAQGLLPPDLRLRAVMEEFVPSEKARAAASGPATKTKAN